MAAIEKVRLLTALLDMDPEMICPNTNWKIESWALEKEVRDMLIQPMIQPNPTSGFFGLRIAQKKDAEIFVLKCSFSAHNFVLKLCPAENRTKLWPEIDFIFSLDVNPCLVFWAKIIHPKMQFCSPEVLPLGVNENWKWILSWIKSIFEKDFSQYQAIMFMWSNELIVNDIGRHRKNGW